MFAQKSVFLYNHECMKNTLDFCTWKGKKNIFLFADIGNSTIDFLLSDLTYDKIYKVEDRDEEMLTSFLESLEDSLTINHLFISSVNKTTTTLLLKTMDEILPNVKITLIDKEMMKTVAEKENIKVDNLDILGSDLFCDIVSKKNTNGEIIIDLGTASKIIYLGKDNFFYGCMIFPGLSSFPKTLNSDTELLKRSLIELNPPLVSLKTAECISSGVINGISALIKETIEELITEYNNQDCKIYLTGGNAYLVKDRLKAISEREIEYDEKHVLKGLLKIAEIIERGE